MSKRFAPLVALVLCLAAFVVACGDDDKNGDGGSKPSTSQSGGLAAAKERLETYVSGGDFDAPPTTSPPAQQGKNVWVINFGQGSPGGSAWGKAAEEAGKALGWKVTQYDAGLDPSKYGAGVLQAVAGQADGIVLVTIDCSHVKAPLERARKAGIKVVAVESLDCNLTDPGAHPLFDAEPMYKGGENFVDALQKLGKSQADWVAADSEGKAKIVKLVEGEAQTNAELNKGFDAELAEVCPDCEVVDTVDFTTAELAGNVLQQKIEQSLVKNPTADYLVVPFDDVMLAGGAAAVRSANRPNLKAVAGAGFAPAVELITKGQGLNATYGLALGWEAFAAMDQLNRLLAGEEPVASGSGVGFVTEDNAADYAKGYEPPKDYKALYRKAWQAGE